MQTVVVNLGVRSYPVYIGHEILPRLGGLVKSTGAEDIVALVTVPVVRELYGKAAEETLLKEGIKPEVLEVPDGEAAKTPEVFMEVVGRLLGLNAGRGALIISLGGGCVGDLAGFVAATYMRGVNLVHVPTTLLAQVDSSVGGKVAINLPDAKNLIGTVYQPRLVLADTALLKTLPPREVGCGMAELIKCGAMLDYRLLESLESDRDALLRLEGARLEEIVSTAVRLKAEVVAGDELDYSSRMLLNFGHTIGHAIEAATAYEGYSHGEAIAVGMVAEAKVSRALDLMSEAEVKRLEGLISAYGLPTRVNGVTLESIAQLIAHDKKVKSGRWRFSLPKRLGEGTVIEDPPREVVLSGIREVIGD